MNTPKVSIGMPAYNAEFYIRSAIDSLLSQTFVDFELIISDNSSTDATGEICKEYANRDDRVRLISQTDNIGAIENFRCVMNQGVAKYFMWAAADDFWHPSFIEKNYNILENNPKVVASISRVKMKTLINKPDQLVGTLPLKGNTINRLRAYFQNIGANSRFYSLYRQEVIKQSFVSNSFMGGDLCTVVNVATYGEFYEVDEVLMERSCCGSSSKLLKEQFEDYNIEGIEKIFPLIRFTIWFWKNSNLLTFLSCLDFLLKFNIFYFLIVLSELFNIRKPKKYSSYSSD